MNAFIDEQLAARPRAQGAVLLDFEKAEVVGGFITDTYILIVAGTKPYVNMTVRLVPRIYIEQPDYWEIEVVGIMPGIGLPVEAPFVETLPLDGITGKKGIEVVGASRSQRFEVRSAPTELCNETGDVSYRAEQVPGGVIITAEGQHGTSGYETFFERSLIDIFPPEFSLKHRSPAGIVLQVITPFYVSTSFNAAETIETVTVHDAQGPHEIAVEQTPD